MPQIQVIVTDQTGTKKTPVELPDDVPMRRLLPALATRMTLPTTSPDGRPIVYSLDHKKSGKRLGDDDTFRSASVEAGDILHLFPRVEAGSSTNIRLKRLQADYDRVRELAANSEIVRILDTDNNPPEKYVIEFACRGVASIDGREQPVIVEQHRVGIYLHATYPREMPGMKWLTPIFHPNIGRNGAVCIDVWYASKSLDELVFMLGEMVQYKNFNPKSPLNPDAAIWADSHRHLFPIDKRPLRTADVFSKIQIGGSLAPSPDADILGAIKIGGEPPSEPPIVINIGD